MITFLGYCICNCTFIYLLIQLFLHSFIYLFFYLHRTAKKVLKLNSRAEFIEINIILK